MKIYLFAALISFFSGIALNAQILPERRTVELDADADNPGAKASGTNPAALRPGTVTGVAGSAAAAAKEKVTGTLAGGKLAGWAAAAANAANQAAQAAGSAANTAGDAVASTKAGHAASSAAGKAGSAVAEFKAGLDGKLEVPPSKFYLALKAANRTGPGPKDVSVQLVDRRNGKDYFYEVGESIGGFALTKFNRDRELTLESDTHRVLLPEGQNLPPKIKPTVDYRTRVEAALAAQQQQQQQQQLNAQPGGQQYYRRGPIQRRTIGDPSTGGFKNRRAPRGIGIQNQGAGGR